MPNDIRIWRIQDGSNLQEIQQAKLDLEERIENWLAEDVSIVRDDLLVIGRQVETDFGGVIDLLCLDRSGDLVILELKRDKTPREITAQTLDYASWVTHLSHDRISEIADRHLGGEGALEEAFKTKFGEDLPDTLNEHHEMLIVASQIDASSERIIEYLSDTYGVGINAVTFQYFKDEEGEEYLARVFLIEPSQVEYSTKTKATSKRKPSLSYEELQDLAEQKGVSDLYRTLVAGLTECFDCTGRTGSSIAFLRDVDGSRTTVLSLIPGESSREDGVRFQVYITRLAEYLGMEEDAATALLPRNREEWKYHKGASPNWCGYAGFIDDMNEARALLENVKAAKRGPQQ